MIIEIVLTYLVLISSFREGNFDAYICSLSAMMPLFFADDNILDSRWGTIHLHHMVTLQKKNQKIYDELMKGNFVVHDSFRRFSDIALDQAHNCLIK